MPITLSIKPLPITSLLLLLGVSLLAQSTVETGVLPVVNVNIGLGKYWELNTKWETRHLLSRSVDGQSALERPDFVLSDQSAIVARKVGLSSKLAAGYLLRIREGDLTHRLIQQFSVVQRLPGFRLAHRFASDQTFAPDDPTEYRLRYRIGTEIALNGRSADSQELYLKVNNEYLGSWQGEEFDLEVRLVPVLGYKFSDINKLELGLDARFDSFLERPSRLRNWGVIAWYYKL